MSTIREGKAAVVEAVRARLDEADAAVVTEYRGLTVAEMATLRRALRAVGGDYKVFKNTLVRRAVADSSHEALTDLLEGPTAIAFVHGDVSAVAKALRDFARGAPSLVVKGGVLDGSRLDARELAALADLPSREVLLSMMVGALAAPMRTMAGLLKALPQNLAYGLAALVEARGGSVAAVVPEATEPGPDEPAPADDAATPQDAAPEGASAEPAEAEAGQTEAGQTEAGQTEAEPAEAMSGEPAE